MGNLIQLFASEDYREREYLKKILHRIYGRFMPSRAAIRRSISNYCYRAIYDQHKVTFEYHDDVHIIDYNNGVGSNTKQRKVLKRMDKSYHQNDIRSENGIAELLEIFCSIVHGFSTPVKREHKNFSRNVLIPLHKCRKYEKFHDQLVACCIQFVLKDPSVAAVMLGMFNHSTFTFS